MRKLSKLIKTAGCANVFEFYEFSIYGLLSTTLAQLFFATTNQTLAVVQSFGLFAASYLIRPLGSLYLGRLSDQRGRSYALRRPLVLMAIPTGLIGILPNYHQAGFLASVGLILLRLTQGFAVGGELPGSSCYVFESAEPRYRSILCSIAYASAGLGVLSGSLTATLLFSYCDDQSILNWAWRLPFLLSIPLAGVLYFIRKDLQEPKQFIASALSDTKKTAALDSQLFRYEVIFLVPLSEVASYLLFIWMPVYLSLFLEVPRYIAYLIITLATGARILFYVLAGYCSSKIGYPQLIRYSLLIFISLIYPCFKLMSDDSYRTIFYAQLFLAFFLSGVSGIIMEMLAHTFPPAIRGRGMNLSFTLPGVLFGSTSPLVCTYVIYKTGWLMFPAFYIMLFGLLALPVALRLKAPSGGLSV